MDKITVIYTPDTEQNPYARKIEISSEANISEYRDLFKRICEMLNRNEQTITRVIEGLHW